MNKTVSDLASHDAKKNRKNHIKGICFIVFSLFLYAFSDALIRMLLIKQYSVEQTTFLRASTRLIPLFIAMLYTHKSLSPLKTDKPWSHLINCVIGCARTYAFMVAFKLIPLAEASALSYTSAIFFVILSVVIMKEKLKRHHIYSIILGAIGVFIALRPGIGVFKFGAILTLVGAFFAAVNKIFIRKLSFRDNTIGIIIYPNLFLLLVTLPFLSTSWKPIEFYDGIIFLIIGAMAALAQYSFALALKLTKGLTLAPYDYTYFCWVILMDYLFNNTIPDIWVILGAIFVIGSNIIIIMHEFKVANGEKDRFLGSENKDSQKRS